MKRINRNAASMLCLCALSMTPCVATRSAVAAVKTTITDQEQTVSGTITDGSEPIIGATVKVKGDKNLGAVTDLDGHFTLRVKPGTIIEVSYVGYKTQTLKAQEGMTIVLKEDTKALDEVVVTALGIKRDRKALGYGVGEVKGEELKKAKETNVINSLAVRWLVSSSARPPVVPVEAHVSCFVVTPR